MAPNRSKTEDGSYMKVEMEVRYDFRMDLPS